MALLVSQDNLQALLKGGWKLSTNSITNYESLAAKLLNANTNQGSIFSLLSPSTLDLLKNKTGSETGQQQVIVDALNQIIQTNQSMLNPELFQGIPLSPETQNLKAQNPQGSDLMRLNYLLILDAVNALSGAH